MESMKNKSVNGGSLKQFCRNCHTKKCALRGKNCKWPELERDLCEWVDQKRQNGFIVTRAMIRIQALAWAAKNQEKSANFKATCSWCTRFMKRSNLVLRQKTKIAQKLPSDLEDKIVSFQKYVIKMDGTEDDLLWEEEEETATAQNDDDKAEGPYDDMITAEEWDQLFGLTDDKEDYFEGFEL